MTGPDATFQIGVWIFTAGTSAADIITATIDNVSVTGTGRGASDWAGMRFEDWSTGSGTRQDVTITACTLTNNLNRGIHVRGANALIDIGTSTFTGNGSNAAAGQEGWGIYCGNTGTGNGSNVTVHNCFITNPNPYTSTNVVAMGTYGGTLNAHDNNLNANATPTWLAKNASATFGSFTANCNWWGSACSQGFEVSPDLISGPVTINTC